MRAFLSVLFALALVGCPTTPDTDGTGTATPPPDNFAKVGDQIDKADARVSAGVQVARNANAAGKPETVERELAVVAAYLPPPDPHNLAYISERVRRNDPAEYKRAMDAGAKLLAVIDANWAKAEADAAKNQKALEAANKVIAQQGVEIKDLKDKLEKSETKAVVWVCSALGGVLALAAVAFGWSGSFIKSGCSAAASFALFSLPYLFASPYFVPGVGIAAAIGLTAGVVWLIWFRKSSPTDEPKEPTA